MSHTIVILIAELMEIDTREARFFYSKYGDWEDISVAEFIVRCMDEKEWKLG